MVGAAALSCIALPAGAESVEPRTAMREAFSALSQLFPASLDEKRFSDSQRREEIEKQFRALSSAAAKIESHGRQRDGGFREDALQRAEHQPGPAVDGNDGGHPHRQESSAEE